MRSDKIYFVRLVIQRVEGACVKVADTNEIVGQIGNGLMVLVGVKKSDELKDAEVLAEKLSKLRVMADENGKMNLSASSFLVVSQFTLYADTKDGNRPSFIHAALPDDAKKIYEYFVGELKKRHSRVETGSFGDYMEIEANLDGPVTIILES